jgi:hypothetical protein
VCEEREREKCAPALPPWSCTFVHKIDLRWSECFTGGVVNWQNINNFFSMYVHTNTKKCTYIYLYFVLYRSICLLHRTVQCYSLVRLFLVSFRGRATTTDHGDDQCSIWCQARFNQCQSIVFQHFGRVRRPQIKFNHTRQV